uniref:DDE-type integrase/transposase/recombinase n=1 Tax=Ruegeria atlantica TaxID=81569 RepID=UPI0024954DF6
GMPLLEPLEIMASAFPGGPEVNVTTPGKTLDFMCLQSRIKSAATKFFARMPEVNGSPRKIVIDKSRANTDGIKAVNEILKGLVSLVPIEVERRRCLNNIVEPDHRFIKRRTRPMLGFKSFVSSIFTLYGIEVNNMIR